jgi:hypothetical protein
LITADSTFLTPGYPRAFRRAFDETYSDNEMVDLWNSLLIDVELVGAKLIANLLVQIKRLNRIVRGVLKTTAERNVNA